MGHVDIDLVEVGLTAPWNPESVDAPLPDGFLFPRGQWLSRELYPELFEALKKMGLPDEDVRLTEFKVPDLEDRSVIMRWTGGADHSVLQGDVPILEYVVQKVHEILGDGPETPAWGAVVPRRAKRIYLAGGKSQEWRRFVMEFWGSEALTHDPFTQSRQGSAYEFTNDDLEAIKRSDLVMAVVDYPVYTGLAAEVGYAHALDIPVILVWDSSSDLTPARVDLFVAACCKAMFTDWREAALFIKERFLS